MQFLLTEDTSDTGSYFRTGINPSSVRKIHIFKNWFDIFFNYEKALERVSLLFALEEEYITGKRRQQDRVRARDLLCYWCATKLGISMAELAKRLDLTLAAVSCAVKRGDKVAKEGNFILED